MHGFWTEIKKRPGLFLFLLALAIRISALAADWDSWYMPLIKDSARYNAIALSMLSGHGLQYFGVSAEVSPLYPLFITGIYALFGLDRFYIFLCQALLGSLLVPCVYRIGSYAFPARVGWIAGLAAAFYWPLVTIGNKLLSEALFIPLLAAAAWCTVLALEKRRAGWFLAGGGLMGLASLARPVTIYFPLIVIAWSALAAVKEKNHGQFRNIALYAAVFFLILLPWGVRNQKELGHFILTNTNTGMVLSTGNSPREGKIFGFNWRSSWLEPSRRYILKLPEVEQSRALTRMAVEDLAEHPEKIPRLILLKTLYFFSPFDWEILGKEEGVFNPWFFWLTIFLIYSLAGMKWQKGYFIPASMIIYFLAVSYATYASPRLRLPVVPFMLIFASAGWAKMEKKAGDGVKARIVLTVVILTSTAGYVFSENLKTALRTLLSWAGIW